MLKSNLNTNTRPSGLKWYHRVCLFASRVHHDSENGKRLPRTESPIKNTLPCAKVSEGCRFCNAHLVGFLMHCYHVTNIQKYALGAASTYMDKCLEFFLPARELVKKFALRHLCIPRSLPYSSVP